MFWQGLAHTHTVAQHLKGIPSYTSCRCGWRNVPHHDALLLFQVLFSHPPWAVEGYFAAVSLSFYWEGGKGYNVLHPDASP